MKAEMIKAFEKKRDESDDPTLKAFIDKRLLVLKGDKKVNK